MRSQVTFKAYLNDVIRIKTKLRICALGFDVMKISDVKLTDVSPAPLAIFATLFMQLFEKFKFARWFTKLSFERYSFDRLVSFHVADHFGSFRIS